MNLVRAVLFALAILAAAANAAQPDAARDAFGLGLAAARAGAYQKALGFFGEAIRLDPGFARAYYNRGVAYVHLDQNERAIKDYSEAIRLDPGFAIAHASRATAFHNLGQYERAIKDYTEAIRLDPDSASAYGNRGLSYISAGQHERAVADLGEAIRLNPQDADSHDSLAWLLATTRSPGLRDGKRAVELALKACELTQWKEASYIDTLAAAYARTGDFASAVKWQTKALEDKAFAADKEAQERLQLYRANKPFPPD